MSTSPSYFDNAVGLFDPTSQPGEVSALATGSMNSIRHVRSSVLSPIRRPIRCNAWREAASVSKECATDVDAPQRCERYVLEVQSYSRNMGWSVINANDPGAYELPPGF